jgi:hypothetical protein
MDLVVEEVVVVLEVAEVHGGGVMVGKTFERRPRRG